MTENAPTLTKADIEPRIRAVYNALSEKFSQLDRRQLKQLEILQPYVQYFKKFKKTYHLFLQLESFIHKNRPVMPC
ncbi:MAG: hypothetical protein ACOCZA_09870 [Spirochaetota bacterium]